MADIPQSWPIYYGKGRPEQLSAAAEPHQWPDLPPWRKFSDGERPHDFVHTDQQIDVINAAIHLRRPILVTGRPGTGKTTLAYAIAHELNLGKVLRWSITTRTTLQDGLYHYDAIARLQDTSLTELRVRANPSETVEWPDIGRYIRLGPLGTALLPQANPRVLLIDELDKSDIDLPNDLLHVFEEGTFEIPELLRLPQEITDVTVGTADRDQTALITRGRVRCEQFPIVIMTSNDERLFPPAFLRRCLRLDIKPPNGHELATIVKALYKSEYDSEQNLPQEIQNIIKVFVERSEKGDLLATDQLLNAISIRLGSEQLPDQRKKALLDVLLRPLSE